jgi:hypothetical protein
VFPLAPGSKIPAFEDTNWQDLATTDTEQITRWWSQAPYNETPPADWGARGIHSGREVLTHVASDAGHRLPRTWTVATPSGGQHLYFRQPDGMKLGNPAGRIGWKIDTRGHGGYVVGAGSMIRGQRYRAEVIRRPAQLPDWIVTALTAQPAPETPTGLPSRRPSAAYGLAALTAHLDKLLASVEGRRNDDLNWAAYALGQVAATGALDPQTIRDELLSAAGRIGLGRREAERTIESGLSAGLRNPRRRC